MKHHHIVLHFLLNQFIILMLRLVRTFICWPFCGLLIINSICNTLSNNSGKTDMPLRRLIEKRDNNVDDKPYCVLTQFSLEQLPNWDYQFFWTEVWWFWRYLVFQHYCHQQNQMEWCKKYREMKRHEGILQMPILFVALSLRLAHQHNVDHRDENHKNWMFCFVCFLIYWSFRRLFLINSIRNTLKYLRQNRRSIEKINRKKETITSMMNPIVCQCSFL